MKRVAVFGKPGGGKSTFSKKLSQTTGIPLQPLDLIEYNPDGTKVPHEQFAAKHRAILNSEAWIIDGYGTPELFHKRLEASDTLIYIDLPYAVHYWWVIKRFLLSPFKAPEGWPEGSKVFQGTVASIKVLKHCPGYWNEQFLLDLYARYPDKTIHVIKTVSELNQGFNTPQ